MRLVLALAEHRHFARASEASNISQPAFSARIQSIEHELGVRLVERGARFERFTDAGEQALESFRKILALVDGLQQNVKGTARALKGQLRIAVIPTQLPVAGELAALLNAKYPEVGVTIQSRSSAAIDAALDRYEADIGITYLDEPRPQRFRTVPLLTETYVFVAPCSYGGVDGEPIAWNAAAGFPLGLLSTDMQNRRIIDASFRSSGASPSVRIESDTFTALMGAVAAGTTATILPRTHAAVFATGQELTIRPLVEPYVAIPVGLLITARDPELPIVAAAEETALQRFSA